MGLFSFLGRNKEKNEVKSSIPTSDIDLKYSSRNRSKY